ncbi:ABC transporter permease [Salipiger sp.]|uniref:ABC transporter permease n=1 Tax=Salipiger sp. TaxID=2078585 RepID=UPI003A977AA3
MLIYILRRIGQGSFSVIGVTILIFVLARTTGNPLDVILPIDATDEMRERLSEQLGLNETLLTQFRIFVTDLLHGDLGNSIRYRVPVWDLFLETFPKTLSLVLPAFLVSIAAGIPLGVIAGTTRRRSTRLMLSGFGLVGLSIPTFWLGILLILIFSLKLHWLPSSQAGGIDHYILPVITLAAFQSAGLMRLVRSSILDVLDMEYIKLARIIGVSETVVIWKHALLNSLTSAASFMGVFIGVLIMGSVVVETVFAWPGSGRLIYNSILSRDFPVVQGLVMVSSIFIITISLLVDILQAYLDPRIRR